MVKNTLLIIIQRAYAANEPRRGMRGVARILVTWLLFISAAISTFKTETTSRLSPEHSTSVIQKNENRSVHALIVPHERNDNFAGSTNHEPLLSIQEQTFQRGQLKENSIVIFVHIPKTGGTTVANNIEFHSPASMIFFTHIHGGRKMWRRGKDHIDHYCSTRTNTKKEEQSLFMEIHTLAPSFVELQDQLQAWRSNATANGKDFFVFTILREPVSWAMSAFNHVHQHKAKELRADQSNQTTVNSVVKENAQENPQCTFLAHSWQYTLPKGRRWSPEKEDCDLVYSSLKNQADFVGTTERLNETTEMLKFLLDLPSNYTFQHENSGITNTAGAYIRIDEMTNETLQYHKQISLLDYELYENVQREWSLRPLPWPIYGNNNIGSHNMALRALNDVVKKKFGLFSTPPFSSEINIRAQV